MMLTHGIGMPIEPKPIDDFAANIVRARQLIRDDILCELIGIHNYNHVLDRLHTATKLLEEAANTISRIHFNHTNKEKQNAPRPDC